MDKQQRRSVSYVGENAYDHMSNDELRTAAAAGDAGAAHWLGDREHDAEWARFTREDAAMTRQHERRLIEQMVEDDPDGDLAALFAECSW
jgi:hypothetical protein